MSHDISVRHMAQFRLRVIKDAERLGSVTDAARLHRLSRQSVHRWIARYDGTLESLMDRSKRPHSHPNQHTREEIRRVLAVTRQNKRLGLVCLWLHLKRNFGYRRTVVALYRLLRREGVIPAPTKKRRRKSKPYEAILVPGERVQVDVKHVPQACLVGGLTSRLQGAMHPSAFEAYLAEEGIRHKLIAVATPRHNGKVERSHRTDDERFYEGNKFYNLRYLREQMERHRRLRNNTPMTVIGLKSPAEMLRRYQEAV